MTVDEFHEVNEALRRDPRIVEALAKRGVTDMERGALRHLGLRRVAHPRGATRPPRRLVRRVGPRAATTQPVRQPDHRPAPDRRPQRHGAARARGHRRRRARRRRWASTSRGSSPTCALRDDIKPIEITQPEGVRSPSTATSSRGSAGRCGSASTRARAWSSTRVGYEDDGRVRPIAHRLSFAEMVVPYRDPTGEHERRTAFDIGEWGLGFMTTSLELGCDCLGEIGYLDAVVHDSHGEPRTIRNAICIHEEDGAVLWKHVDERRRRVRRMRRLVDLLPRDGRQLRVPRLLALPPGREHRVRGPRDRDHGHDAVRGRAAAVRDARRRAHLRAVPPALPRRPPRPRHRRRGQHRLRDRLRGAPDRARATRTGWRWCSARRRCAPRTRASRTTTGTASARGRSSTTGRATGSARRRPTSSSPAARCPP